MEREQGWIRLRNRGIAIEIFPEREMRWRGDIIDSFLSCTAMAKNRIQGQCFFELLAALDLEKGKVVITYQSCSPALALALHSILSQLPSCKLLSNPIHPLLRKQRRAFNTINHFPTIAPFHIVQQVLHCLRVS